MDINFSFTIDHDNAIPKYQQIVNVVNEAVAQNRLEIGDSLPSVNSLCNSDKLSRDTVFKAYSILKENGVIKSVPNKGYYIASKTRKVLLVLDTFKAYKEVLYHSFISTMGDDIITDVQFHHYNIENFKTIINNSIGKYYKYVVMGFDHKIVPKILSKINNQNLLLIDWNIHAKPENNYVFQDFGKSFYSSMETIVALFSKYQEIHFLYPTYTSHPKETLTYFEKFCIDSSLKYQIKTNPKEFNIEKGIAYISVSDRVLGIFLEQCREKNLEPGVDVGFISYNDTPMKKFIYKGVSVITTDFEELGAAAAKFVNHDEAMQMYIPTKIILRDSL
tara:strand:- start:178674 stop:179672 length:999 start_codon:yes stop_codon:yes gene_type:complete